MNVCLFHPAHLKQHIPCLLSLCRLPVYRLHRASLLGALAGIIPRCALACVYTGAPNSNLHVQDQDTFSKLWLFGHKLLLGLHMASHTWLNKAAPKLFAGPRMMPLVMGAAPYSTFTKAMYRDGFVAVVTIVVAMAAIAQRLNS